MNYEASAVTSDREAIVNGIITNLDDKRYGNRFCITQELIQNADDAKAERLLIGYGRLSNGPHTLLAEDGIFFVNDGRLTQDDRKHLFKVATSNKASDKDKIGHFGLGMKSVFHLCEAFFLIFEQPENRKQLGNDADFLDPWYDDRDGEVTPLIRKKWHEEFTSSGEAISTAFRNYLAPWVKDWPRWFCVWLPLRKRWMYDESCPPFKNICWNMEDVKLLFSLELSPVIAEMLPFLKVLREVTLLNAVDNDIIDKISVSAERRLSLKSGCLDMLLEHTSKTLPILQVIGYEKLYEQEQFEYMMRDAEWPRSSKRDKNGEFCKEKITPHTAVYWARSEGVNGSVPTFSVKHCVFLPLTSERQKYVASTELPFDLTLCLHATLFVDAGRQDFSTSADEKAPIEKRWNHLLVSKGLLSMVIPSFEREVSTWGKEDQITQAVKSFNVYLDRHDEEVPELNYRRLITQQYQFLNCLTETGWKWQRITSSKAFLYIPLTQDKTLQEVLLQKLSTQELLLVPLETPGITSSSTVEIDDAIFKRLRITIDNLPAINRYTTTFIKWLGCLMSKYPMDASRQRELLTVFLDKIRVQDYLKHQDEIYKLMVHFSEATQKIRLAKTNWDEDTFALWKRAGLQKGIQIIPMPFCYSETEWPEIRNEFGEIVNVSDHKTIPVGDLEILFPFIAEKMTKADEDEKRRALFKSIIFNYLKRCPIAGQNETICKLKIFAFFDQDGECVFLPLEMIKDDAQPIFLRSGGSTFMPTIAKAANIVYYLFPDNDSFYTDLMKQFGLTTFTLQEIDRFFQSGKLPELNSVESRVDLFQALIGDDLPRYIDIARYLLLGDPLRFESREDLYILPHENSIAPKAMEFWDGMLQMFFEKTGNVQTTLPQELTSCLRRGKEGILNIYSLDRDEILRRLKDVEFGKSMPSYVNVNHKSWKYLVDNFNHSDRICCQVAMRLPVFPIQDDRFAPLDDMIYFNSSKCRMPDIVLSLYNCCEIPPDKIEDLYDNVNKKLPLWSHKDTLKFCTEYKNDFPADNLAPYIEKALKEVIKDGVDLDENIISFLTNQQFLMCINGDYARPEQMVNLPDLPDNLKEIIHNCGLLLYEDIQIDRFTKEAWKWCEDHILPLDDTYPSRLGSALASQEKFCLGELPKNNDVVRDDVTDYFKGCAVARVIFPAIDFVEQLLPILPDKKQSDFAIPAFLTPLANGVSTKRLIDICNQLLEQETKRPSELYLVYLAMLVNRSDFNDNVLSLLRLPNAKGQSSKAADLIHSGNGISPSQVLHPKCAKILHYEHGEKGRDISAHLPEFRNSHNLVYDLWKKKVDQTCKKIEAYFDGWGDDFRYHIATLIILCDDSSEMQEYVKSRHWPNGDAENIRRMIQVPGVDFAQKYKGCRLFVDIYDGGRRKMPNLLGSFINVNLAQVDELDSLLVGDKDYSCIYVDQPVSGRRSECKSVYLCLRRLSTEERHELGQEKLMKLLVETIRILMYKMTLNHYAADDIFADIKQNELLDLEIIREVILDGLHSYLPSLGIKKSSLNTILDDWHDLNTQLIQAKQRKNAQDRIAELEGEIQSKKKELREAVETDTLAQHDILQAIITRITEHCGYDFDSIPFELFQNADDAAKEMELDTEDLSNYKHMVIRLSDDALTILHFGRPINKSIGRREENRENAKGFQDDLEKMLQLWRSDKEIGALKRTGKFGLGFKSVYQLTDAPLIASAHLRFRIKGTLFPIYASDKEKQFLEEQINDMKMEGCLSAPLPQETLFYLPIREGINVQSYGDKRLEGAMSMRLDLFIDSADLLVIFSHAIKTLDIVDKRARWNISYQCNKTECGIEIVGTRSGHDYGVIRLPKSGVDIVLGYDAEKDKFKRLDDSIATIWITEPTKEKYRLGFAVNGDFAVDIGRNSLMATNKHNEELSKGAGEELYQFLQTQNEKSPFSTSWLHSLWDCFTGGGNSGQWKVRNTAGVGMHLPGIIWGTRDNLHGYGKFLKDYPAIPTGLARNTSSFLRLRECKYYCEEELMDEDNWRLFAPFSQKHLENTVSHQTYETLSNILNIQLEEVTGKMILENWLQERPLLSPTRLNGRPWKDIIEYCERKGYSNIIGNLVSKSHFLSRSQTSVAARDLISQDTASNDEYETLLKFADESSILSDEYDEQARKLFALANSHDQHFNKDYIANWALNAKKDDAIKAVCHYLVIGKYSLDLAKRLAHEKNLNPEIEQAVRMRLGTWTSDSGNEEADNDSSAQGDALAQDTLSLLDLLREKGIITDEADAPGEGPENSQEEMTPSVLNWLLDNWPHYKRDIVTKYNRDNYGIASEELPPYPLKLDDDLSARQRWMELFILAMCRKIGRQKDVQHFGFIQKCRSLHWMDVFALPDEPLEVKSQKWIGLLDNCFDKYGTTELYSHWMQLYPWIYHVNKFLVQYVRLFRGINKETFIPDNQKDIFNPSESDKWSGANLHIPPLRYALGFLGPHWILRELVRSRTLNNPSLHPYCYLPSTAVKRLFNSDDMTSQEIYEKLKGETFDLNFDIAFKALDHRYW